MLRTVEKGHFLIQTKLASASRPKNDFSREGSSDHLQLVDIKHLL